MDSLKSKLTDLYGDNPSPEQIISFAERTAYLCRMYWQNRTDKLNSDDYELYRCLTNDFTSINAIDNLPLDHIPKYGRESLFVGKYPQNQLEREVRDEIISRLTHYKKSNRTSLLDKIKGLLTK